VENQSDVRCRQRVWAFRRTGCGSNLFTYTYFYLTCTHRNFVAASNARDAEWPDCFSSYKLHVKECEGPKYILCSHRHQCRMQFARGNQICGRKKWTEKCRRMKILYLSFVVFISLGVKMELRKEGGGGAHLTHPVNCNWLPWFSFSMPFVNQQIIVLFCCKTRNIDGFCQNKTNLHVVSLRKLSRFILLRVK
jgi:hypothetical protein